ncbi:beta-ketoacyl-ACP synthase II [Rickettsiales endosymbiont of Trichoplax sp. H2]|uniref:beta-ketoacyl-ACP synthase II n=1 Tax=Rickettsiales endosymbiont of Trichoplax sp. H2 TaxID=2021221 RepID=UPI0012B215AE|nr:beta-ketoacyl-ACP synthase II [Rickettsiales endosymbiont of Trichoplax sp. H2]MSO13863.1 3-oxoacyl-[acyl-carrier-protein] synthase 2 [Rickettsiales endosymbiont of Trichoplax sp. H2]
MIRVVVTGIGLITPLGITANDSWNNIINSKSGIKKIPDSLFSSDDLNCKIAGIIPSEFNIEEFVDSKESKKMDKFIHYAIAAAEEAISDANLKNLPDGIKEEIGVLIGSGIGGLSTIEKNANILELKGPRRISPFFIPASLINLASGHVSIKHGFKGPNHSVVTACSTGTHAIGDAARIIKDGDAKIMVCGGAEGAVCKLGVAGFAAARALSTNFNDSPEQASRPWDKDRDGFVMGEGAGILILEEYEHAKKRRAKIYGEVVGYGLSGDAHHITAPESEGKGAIKAMKMALAKAKIAPEEVDYINAHGTSTPLGDVIELNSIKKVFKNNIKDIAISSTKSSIGHLLGAAGSVEAIISLLAIQDSILPPTLNLNNPDESCEGINLVANTPQSKKINCIMSNSFGFGGTNSCLVFKKV